MKMVCQDIPRYPKSVQNTIVAFGVCPNCGSGIKEYNDCVCGQKIIWKYDNKINGYISEQNQKFKPPLWEDNRDLK